ncbi:hypothetical protein H0H92_007871 [Tricholoma furcatifolium]|nr:hypothetical protein H0H92_007871 [Tricholoma furcatifolium]
MGPQLFQPTKVGTVTLSHRVVLAPLTRFRATKSTHVPVLPLVKDHYAQRARVPGTLLITEGTFIDVRAGGFTNVPGLWSDEQIAAWKEITDAVHANGSFIFVQLWALGRAAEPAVLASYDPSAPYPFVGASDKPLSSNPAISPRGLTVDEIQEYVSWYARAAHNAVHRAGFDGVEVHGANGYLIDQFLQDTSNTRTDDYGGSVEKRSQFALEVVDAVVKAVGPERTGIRLSPWSLFQDMRMADPIPQFSHVVTSLRTSYPSLAYIHAVEPSASGSSDSDEQQGESNDFLRTIWGSDRVFISAGGHTRETALKTVEAGGEKVLVAFGRHYTSNPDLPLKLKYNVELEPYNRNTFYTLAHHPDTHVGYIDYPFAKELLEREGTDAATKNLL